MSSSGRKSIFAQRMLSKRENSTEQSKSLTTNNVQTSNPDEFGRRSFVLSGPDAEAIHKENAAKLSNMSVEEITEERNKLLSELSPGLIEFLKSRRRQSGTDVSEPTAKSSRVEQEANGPQVTDSDMSDVQDRVSALKVDEKEEEEPEEVRQLAHKYVHMDVVENEKLKWIGDLKNPSTANQSLYSARFNFQGDLLPFMDQGKGILEGLHNHGAEQERPGYSVEELLHLSRSSVLQQRLIALKTLANLLSKAHCYEACFQESLRSVLLGADLFLFLRFSLDDPSQPVVMASVRALANLMVRFVDEDCLDRMLGTPLGLEQPSLEVTLDMKAGDMAELTDQQLTKLDVVQGALRTDLLTRLGYILTKLNPEPVDVKQLLGLVTRICRHSFEACSAVLQSTVLMQAVRSLLDTPIGNSHYPEALKLMRVLAARSRSMAATLLELYSPLEPAFQFIAWGRGVGHPELMQVVLESFYLWQVMLSYGLALDSIGGMVSVLGRLLEAHLGVGELDGKLGDLDHGTALLSTCSVITKTDPSLITPLHKPLVSLSIKYSTQLLALPLQQVSTSGCKLLGAALTLAATLRPYQEEAQSLRIKANVNQLLSSPLLVDLLKTLKASSWWTRDPSQADGVVESLPELGFVQVELWPVPLVSGLVRYLVTEAMSEEGYRLGRQLVSHPQTLEYLKLVLSCQHLASLASHWYARPELALLLSLVHLYWLSKPSTLLAEYHALALSLPSLVHQADRHWLCPSIFHVLFSPEYFRGVIEAEGVVSEALSELGEVESCYLSQLSVVEVGRRPRLTLSGPSVKAEGALPWDWPFLPILRLHQALSDTPDARLGAPLARVVRSCLLWVLILERARSALPWSTSQSAAFTRLCSVFLMDSQLFHDLAPLLDALLGHITDSPANIDFTQPIPGLTSFYDFYRELVDQYLAVSYCNPVFAKYVLTPMERRHDSKYRKLIWCEMTGVFRIIPLPVDQVKMQLHLEPLEEDPELLTSYLTCLGRGLVRESWTPVLYRTALHHVATYVRLRSDSLASSLRSHISTLTNQTVQEQLLNYSYPP